MGKLHLRIQTWATSDGWTFPCLARHSAMYTLSIHRVRGTKHYRARQPHARWKGIEKHFFTNAILRDACSVLGWMNLTWMMAGPTGVGAMGKQWFLRSGGNYTLAVDSGCRGLMQTVTVGLFQWIKGSKWTECNYTNWGLAFLSGMGCPQQKWLMIQQEED